VKLWLVAPGRGPGTSHRISASVRTLLAVCALCATASHSTDAAAQPKKGGAPAASAPKDAKDAGTGAVKVTKNEKGEKVQHFDFTGLDISGRMRTPQLLYFLERANEELERASLEKRSFIPSMVRSVDEEAL
jgi:hypothetical protein